MARPLASATATARSRPGSSAPSAGMTTVSTTTARSSTRVMPIITRPWAECSSPRSMRRRASTIVLATDTTRPMTSPCSERPAEERAHAHAEPRRQRDPERAAESATHLTRSRSESENSMPMENISSTTPTSATTSKVWTSDSAGPGVSGLITMPPAT